MNPPCSAAPSVSLSRRQGQALRALRGLDWVGTGRQSGRPLTTFVPALGTTPMPCEAQVDGNRISHADARYAERGVAFLSPHACRQHIAGVAALAQTAHNQ